MNSLNRILNEYSDALYCASMLGGEYGKERERNAFEVFKTNLEQISEQYGLNREDHKLLLKVTIMMNAKAFLFVLKLFHDFNAFSTVLDDLEEQMAQLNDPEKESEIRKLEFLKLVSCIPGGELPAIADFKLYKEMREAMLSQNLLFQKIPNGKKVCFVVDQFESKFKNSANFVGDTTESIHSIEAIQSTIGFFM